MSSIQLQIYDFAMAAGGSFPLPVAGSYFRILTTVGDVDVVGDTFGRLGPINRGQGLADKQYGRLTIQDRSGAPNAGTILVSDSNFIDQTLFGSISLAGAVALDAATLAALEYVQVRPELPTSSFITTTAYAAGTATTVFTPAANTNGALISEASISIRTNTNSFAAFLAKSSAPSSITDGDPVLVSGLTGSTGTDAVIAKDLKKTLLLPPGVGLYFYNTALQAAATDIRSCRYKLL